VRGNITYGADRGGGVPLAGLLRMLEIEPLIDPALHRLPGAERQRGARGRALPGLAGGGAPRCAPARALASSRGLLLLEEPLSAVDVPLRRRILESLGAWIVEAGIPAIPRAPAEAELRG